MRKRLKRKRRSCGLCKPNKVGGASRWPAKEADALARDEREIREALRDARRGARSRVAGQ
ncbi:MAG: hypothetical protein IPK07_05515 [Deltaproteobacteria bacterium]|nr:hypothetical protein [Deltaproteobacteria bacterium]